MKINLKLSFTFYKETKSIISEIEKQIKWVNSLFTETLVLDTIECNYRLAELLNDDYIQLVNINPNKKDNHYILNFRSE